MGCRVTTAWAPYLHWKQLKWKITSRKRGKKFVFPPPFYFFFLIIRKPRNADTARCSAPIQPSPALDGAWYQQHLKTSVGAWPKSWLYTAVAHCARPLWFFHPTTFCHPLEADLSRSLLSGTVFSNPNSDNYLWFCCWLERRLLDIESPFPSIQKLRVRRRGISVPASLSNTWHQMHMWGWPPKINEFNRKEQAHTWISV